jgi:hypothetical protein
MAGRPIRHAPRMTSGGSGARAYTPSVRRWVCVIVLLFGFSGDQYAWTARPRIPVPIERVMGAGRRERDLPEGAWWRLR